MAGLGGVPGLRVGHWTHDSGTTGTTVVVFPAGATGGIAVPGHAPGSREHGALSPLHLAERIDAFVLSGGSAFGLATADGVMAVLAERGMGFPTSVGPVPIVPAAILFDLPVGAVRPGAEAGRAAAEAALAGGGPEEGFVGAGAGARFGKVAGEPVRGGIGSASRRVGAWQVGALVALNALGCVRDPDTGAWFPGPPMLGAANPLSPGPREQTTLAVVATDAPLSRPQCTTVARMAVAGLARTISPAFTPFDGDTVFVGATGQGEAPGSMELLALGHAAAEALAEAVLRVARRSWETG